jgi:predicted AlkP superfamily pyrophosphatase or phosphodiesterase
MAITRDGRRAVALISIDGLPADVLDSPAIRLPRLRGLGRRGVQVTGLRPVFPSVTWPCHTTFVTGVSPARHGVLGNHVLDRRTGALVSHYGDRTGAPVRAETLWDRAATAGLRAAAVCWPKTRGASGLADCIPEVYDQPLFEVHATRPLWAELRDAGLPVDRYGAWSAAHPLGPLQDWLSLAAAAWLLHRRPPDLLLLHFLVADSFQDDYGPASPEAYWALEYVDGLVGRLLDVLDETGRAGSTDVVVVGDHGFAEVRELASRTRRSTGRVCCASMAPGGFSTMTRAWWRTAGPRTSTSLQARSGRPHWGGSEKCSGRRRGWPPCWDRRTTRIWVCLRRPTIPRRAISC